MRWAPVVYFALLYLSSTVNGSEPDIFVVVARYNENIDHLGWLANISHIVYNRGSEIRGKPNLKTISRYENVGRESFLYLDHIINHYDNLPDLIVFTQAAHRETEVYNFTNSHFEATILGLKDGSVQLHPLSDGFAYLLPICYNFEFGVKTWGFRRDNFFKKLLNFEVAFPRFGPTGCFAVKRETILRNSKEYFSRLIRSINSENSPRVGHFIERAWPEVFHSNCSSSQNETSNYFCSIQNIPNDTCELRL